MASKRAQLLSDTVVTAFLSVGSIHEVRIPAAPAGRGAGRVPVTGDTRSLRQQAGPLPGPATGTNERRPSAAPGSKSAAPAAGCTRGDDWRWNGSVAAATQAEPSDDDRRLNQHGRAGAAGVGAVRGGRPDVGPEPDDSAAVSSTPAGRKGAAIAQADAAAPLWRPFLVAAGAPSPAPVAIGLPSEAVTRGARPPAAGEPPVAAAPLLLTGSLAATSDPLIVRHPQLGSPAPAALLALRVLAKDAASLGANGLKPLAEDSGLPAASRSDDETDAREDSESPAEGSGRGRGRSHGRGRGRGQSSGRGRGRGRGRGAAQPALGPSPGEPRRRGRPRKYPLGGPSNAGAAASKLSGAEGVRARAHAAALALSGLRRAPGSALQLPVQGGGISKRKPTTGGSRNNNVRGGYKGSGLTKANYARWRASGLTRDAWAPGEDARDTTDTTDVTGATAPPDDAILFRDSGAAGDSRPHAPGGSGAAAVVGGATIVSISSSDGSSSGHGPSKVTYVERGGRAGAARAAGGPGEGGDTGAVDGPAAAIGQAEAPPPRRGRGRPPGKKSMRGRLPHPAGGRDRLGAGDDNALAKRGRGRPRGRRSEGLGGLPLPSSKQHTTLHSKSKAGDRAAVSADGASPGPIAASLAKARVETGDRMPTPLPIPQVPRPGLGGGGGGGDGCGATAGAPPPPALVPRGAAGISPGAASASPCDVCGRVSASIGCSTADCLTRSCLKCARLQTQPHEWRCAECCMLRRDPLNGSMEKEEEENEEEEGDRNGASEAVHTAVAPRGGPGLLLRPAAPLPNTSPDDSRRAVGAGPTDSGEPGPMGDAGGGGRKRLRGHESDARPLARGTGGPPSGGRSPERPPAASVSADAAPIAGSLAAAIAGLWAPNMVGLGRSPRAQARPVPTGPRPAAGAPLLPQPPLPLQLPALPSLLPHAAPRVSDTEALNAQLRATLGALVAAGLLTRDAWKRFYRLCREESSLRHHAAALRDPVNGSLTEQADYVREELLAAGRAGWELAGPPGPSAV